VGVHALLHIKVRGYVAMPDKSVSLVEWTEKSKVLDQQKASTKCYQLVEQHLQCAVFVNQWVFI